LASSTPMPEISVSYVLGKALLADISELISIRFKTLKNRPYSALALAVLYHGFKRYFDFTLQRNLPLNRLRSGDRNAIIQESISIFGTF
jgi:hypothetical protein